MPTNRACRPGSQWVGFESATATTRFRAEVSEMIAVEAPYVAERQLILEFMVRTSDALHDIKVEQRGQRDIVIEVRTKLDLLLDGRGQ